MRSANPNVSVDCVIFGFDESELKVLLIQRDTSRNDDRSLLSWSLPGDLINDTEDLPDAAHRVLKELTGLDSVFLRQFKAFGHPSRVRKPSDKQWLEKMRAYPEARVITVAYFALVNINEYEPQPSYFAVDTKWWSIDDIPQLAFDHNEIVRKGLTVMRNSIQTEPIVFELLDDKFTLSELQHIYEVILKVELDKRNFRKKILAMGILEELNEKQKGVTHKPAKYYTLLQNQSDKINFSLALN